MKKDKKKYPDNVVFDEEKGFNANILPYGTNVGAPAIRPDDVSEWKQRGVNKVNQVMFAKFNELKEEYQKLVQEYKWNELVYKSQFSFEPVIGNTYYLYVRDVNSEMFLSLIEPHLWNQKYVGTFKLNSESKWIKINEEN